MHPGLPTGASTALNGMRMFERAIYGTVSIMVLGAEMTKLTNNAGISAPDLDNENILVS